jgi:hypothetical protein
MAKALFATAYTAIALYFLRGYLPRPTMFGVLASLLWPLSLALTLTWLMRIEDDALSS